MYHEKHQRNLENVSKLHDQQNMGNAKKKSVGKQHKPPQ